jgi:phosphatidylglycerophosphate synthase
MAAPGTGGGRRRWPRRRAPLKPRRTPAAMAAWLTIPTVLSLLRLPLAALFLLVPDTAVRVLVIAAAGISDYLDGWWARTRGPRTRVGAVVDPVTDKVFLVTALTAFAVDGTITAVALLVLLSRDVAVGIGVIVLLSARRAFRYEARYPGKVTTNVQIAALLVLTLVPGFAMAAVIATGIASAWAIVDYGAAAVSALRAPARQG